MSTKNISFLIVFSVILSLIFFCEISSSFANDHGKKSYRNHHDNNLFSFSHRQKDKGDEFTGELSAWMFFIANITVFLTLLLRGMPRLLNLNKTSEEKILFFNKLQKKYLKYFHYILNPLSLIIAFIHFSLSSCRTSSLPEWGLLSMTVIVMLGIFVKLKLIPHSIRKNVYRFHTNSIPFGCVIIILFLGHSIVD